MIYFFGYEWHKRMQKLERADKNIRNYVLTYLVFLCTLFIETSLCKLNIPVAKNIPCKVINGRERHADLVFVKCAYNRCYQTVEFVEQPFVLGGKLCFVRKLNLVDCKIHSYKS